MTKFIRLRNKSAITMMEICIVVALSSIILGVGFAMMTRSNRQFKKGNDMINIQRLMDNIVEKIRSDVRSLKKVKTDECDEYSFSFVIIDKDGEDADISYKFDPEEKTLYRSVKSSGEDVQTDFHGAKQVNSMVFKPEFVDENSGKFKRLSVAMQIASNEMGGNKNEGSTLSIACQFYSTCVESELRIANVKSID